MGTNGMDLTFRSLVPGRAGRGRSAYERRPVPTSATPVPVAAPSPVERRSGGGGSSRAGGSAVGSAAGDKPRRKRRTGASSVASSQYGEMTI